MKASVSGLGKAGLPLACVMADAGVEVIGLDISKERVAAINSGQNPLPEEPGLGELIKKHAGKGLRATTDPKEAIGKTDYHVIIVPLFIDADNNPDFRLILDALADVGRNMKKGDTVVVETTLPVGSAEGIVRKALEKASGMGAGSDFYLAMSPERIMTGYSISRFREFPKIIGGINKESAHKALELYSRFTANPIVVSNARTAEMIKVSEGIYRDVNIALANELYGICELYGIDFSEMRKHANHQYCNIHEAGLGPGGHCIPVYPWFVIKDMEKRGKPGAAELVLTARRINERLIAYWAGRIGEELKNAGMDPKKARICINGISYRKGVKETYNSRPIALAKELEARGYHAVCYDELFSREELEKMGLKPGKPEDCDLVFNPFENEKGMILLKR